MRTLWLMVAMVIAAGLFCVPASAAGPRYGVVVDMQPIENRGEDESQTTKAKRKMGGMLGAITTYGIAVSGKGNTTAGAMASQAAPAAGEYAATKIGDQGPATRYMVKVKLDSGKTLSVTQLREQLGGAKVGSRVRVEGKGDDALIYAE